MDRIIKLLLLEDSEGDAKLILRLLERSKLVVINKTVSRKEEYLRELDVFAPDIIISDHQLPHFNSNEALRIGREHYPFIPFILVTGTVSEEFAASIIKAGADDYLLKNNLNRLPTAVVQAIDKKQTEEQLKNAHDRILFHIDNAPLAFIEYDNMATVKTWSKMATEIFGWTEDEVKIMQSNGLSMVYEDDRPHVAMLSEKLRTGEIKRNKIQHRNLTKDGKIIWCEWFNSVLLDKNGKVVTIMSLVQDISERKQIEENLERLIDRFKQAQLIAHLGHWEVNLQTKTTNWSEETFRIFGLVPDSVLPSEEIFMSHIHAEDRAMVRSCIEDSKVTFKPFSFYHRVVPKRGAICSIYSAGHCEFDRFGRPLGLYGVMLDITELTDKEKKLKEVNRELETFIYKTYHDLRSPIVSILGIVNIARKEIADENALTYFSIIEEVTLKQNKMLLNLVKVMSLRDRQLMVEPVELGFLVKETLQGLEKMEAFSRMKFTLNEDIHSQVMTDRELIFNMLFQLLENSILYCDPAQREPTVSIYLSAGDPDQVIMKIIDNGIGIPPDTINKVFDMFYRGTVLSKGSGLGLYIVKNAVEKLNGSITLSSQPNQGSTFLIRFPAKSVSPLEAASSRAQVAGE